jgi:hypothetical protein
MNLPNCPVQGAEARAESLQSQELNDVELPLTERITQKDNLDFIWRPALWICSAIFDFNKIKIM